MVRFVLDDSGNQEGSRKWRVSRFRPDDVAGRKIAEALEVSLRTIYRDCASLQAMGVPVEGEAGVGYVMRRGFDLSPLTFTRDEAEAALADLKMPGRTGDGALIGAAARAESKLVVARQVAGDAETPRRLVSQAGAPDARMEVLQTVRTAVDTETGIDARYRERNGRVTRQQLRPLCLIYYPDPTVLAVWCELWQSFRHFRSTGSRRLSRPARASRMQGRLSGNSGGPWTGGRRTIRKLSSTDDQPPRRSGSKRGCCVRLLPTSCTGPGGASAVEEWKEIDRPLDAVREWTGHQTSVAALGAHCVIRHGITWNPSNGTDGTPRRTSRRQVASRRSGEIVRHCRCKYATRGELNGTGAAIWSRRRVACRCEISMDATSSQPWGTEIPAAAFVATRSCPTGKPRWLIMELRTVIWFMSGIVQRG